MRSKHIVGGNPGYLYTLRTMFYCYLSFVTGLVLQNAVGQDHRRYGHHRHPNTSLHRYSTVDIESSGTVFAYRTSTMEVLENRDMAPAPVVIIGGFQQDLGMPQLWSSPTPMNSVGKTRGNASEPKVVPIIAPDQLQSSLLSSLEDNTGTPVASIPIHIPATPTPALEMNQIRPTEDSVSHFLSQKMPSSENVTISPITEKETTGHGNPPRENSNTTYVTPPSLSEAEPSTDLKPVSPFLDTVPSDDLATSPLPCHSSSQYLDLVNPDAWAICKSHPRIFVDDDGDNNEDLENELEAQNVPSPFLSIPQPRTTVTLVPSSPASPIADIGAKYSSPRTDLSLLINKP